MMKLQKTTENYRKLHAPAVHFLIQLATESQRITAESRRGLYMYLKNYDVKSEAQVTPTAPHVVSLPVLSTIALRSARQYASDMPVQHSIYLLSMAVREGVLVFILYYTQCCRIFSKLSQ